MITSRYETNETTHPEVLTTWTGVYEGEIKISAIKVEALLAEQLFAHLLVPSFLLY